MKHLCLICLLVSAISSQSFSQGKPNIGAHIGAGFALGTAAGFVPQFKVVDRPGKAIWIGGAVGAMAGLSKEFHDYASGYPMDKGDLLNTIWGGFVGGVLACEIQKGIARRRAKKSRLVKL